MRPYNMNGNNCKCFSDEGDVKDNYLMNINRLCGLLLFAFFSLSLDIRLKTYIVSY